MPHSSAVQLYMYMQQYMEDCIKKYKARKTVCYSLKCELMKFALYIEHASHSKYAILSVSMY